MKPLEDIRILAIEQYGAGPFCSMHLADLGADVIKIEDPGSGGDVGRYVPPYQDGEDSLFFQTFNRNKRSLSLDLGSEAGRQVFADLVRGADAVFSNLRGDVPVKLGITYADLSEINPAIVCVSLSGFGNSGSHADRPGYDYILQGMTGWMSLTGEPDAPPAKSGLSLVDFSGGLVAAVTLLAAIHAARRDGRGSDCDLALYDVAASMLTYDATWHLNGEWEPVRRSRSSHPSLVPFQLFRGSDGPWFVVACAKEKFWRRLASALGRPDLADDARFSDFSVRRGNRDELIAILDDAFASESSSHWLDVLGDAGVPVGPVHSVPEALADPALADRGMIIEMEHDSFGPVKTLRSPVRVGTDDPTYRRAPERNEHGPDILNELGYSSDDVDRLTSGGAFG